MKYILQIKRGTTRENQRWESFEYEAVDDRDTVATALVNLPVRWEHSCHQKKCGACAMVVNGKPVLACDTRLCELKGEIKIEPLKKFPLVEDLVVDRSILQENLKTMKVWMEEESERSDRDQAAYEASRCLQCGLCLEVCPGFYPGGEFFGMAAMSPTARLFSKLPGEEQKALKKAYRSHVYKGCAKSLACRNICPAGMDIDSLLARSNSFAIWKRKL